MRTLVGLLMFRDVSGIDSASRERVVEDRLRTYLMNGTSEGELEWAWKNRINGMTPEMQILSGQIVAATGWSIDKVHWPHPADVYQPIRFVLLSKLDPRRLTVRLQRHTDPSDYRAEILRIIEKDADIAQG